VSESGATRRRLRVRRWMVLPLSAAPLLALAVALLATRGDDPTYGGFDTRQLEYQRQFGVDRAALFPGKVTYPRGLALDAGESVSMVVQVERGLPEPAAGDGEEAAVLVGGLVAARLAGDQEVVVDEQSPQRQPVVAPGDRATWRYAVSVADPGARELVLTVVTYREGTDEPLATSGPFVIPVDAGATLGYRLRQVQGAVAGVLAFVGVSGGVALAWLWRRLRRRNATDATPPEAAETTPAPATPEAATPEAATPEAPPPD
jgi:hypothetical protein